jgi:hypothetical protein
MDSATVDILVSKAHFEPARAVAVAEAMDMAIQKGFTEPRSVDPI